jgi:hypothetical protein
MKVLTYFISRMTARPIVLRVILVKMSVTTFKIVVILYIEQTKQKSSLLCTLYIM